MCDVLLVLKLIVLFILSVFFNKFEYLLFGLVVLVNVFYWFELVFVKLVINGFFDVILNCLFLVVISLCS